MKFLHFLESKKIVLWIFYLFLISVPFGTKKFIYAFGQPISEFNSVFLYGSDILLVLFLIAFVCHLGRGGFLFKRSSRSPDGLGLERSESHRGESAGRVPPLERGDGRFSKTKIRREAMFLVLFLVFTIVSIFLASYKILAVYQFVRLALLVLAAFAVPVLLKEKLVKINHVIAVIAGSALFQAFVAIFQFKFFKSLGLWWLGEPVVDVFTKNVGWFRVDDLTFLRSFGTLPHANILAAFLVLGLLAFYYFYLRNKHKLLSAIGILFILFALAFTFSRSGWITAVVTTLLFLVWGLFNKIYRHQTLGLVFVLFATTCLIFNFFGWLISPRAHLSVSEPSVSYRWIYDLIGLEIIKDAPLGVGIGNQLLYGVENGFYQKHNIFESKDWQPIHNIYLLIASEIGILGLLAFLIFLLKSAVNRWKFDSLELVSGYLLLITLLLFGLVDHFPWTLQSGRLMLWLAIGLVLGSRFIDSNK